MKPMKADERANLSRRGILASAVLAAVGCSATARADARSSAPFGSSDLAVEIKTNMGNIRFDVLTRKAPKVSAWFLNQVDAKIFDSTKFFRAGHLQGQPARPRFLEGGILSPFLLGESDLMPSTAEQAGLPLLYDWETTDQSGLRHVRGSVSMARDITGRGGVLPDLFIALETIGEMDAGGGYSPQNMGYPVFGQVTAGMEIVDAIASTARDRKTYVPFLNGQILSDPVVIERIVRVPSSAGASA